MTWCQVSLSFAFLQAVWTPKLWGWTSSSITLSQVDLGRPGGLRQSGGGRSAAAITRWWSSSGADRAKCPKNLNRNDLTFSETDKQPVVLLTVSFVVCLVYEIRKIFRRHQVSKASRRFARVLLNLYLVAKYGAVNVPLCRLRTTSFFQCLSLHFHHHKSCWLCGLFRGCYGLIE